MLIFYGVIVCLLAALRIWGAPLLHLELRPPADVLAYATIDFFLALSAAALIDKLVRALFWRAYFRSTQGHEAPALLRDLTTVLVFAIALLVWLHIDLN